MADPVTADQTVIRDPRFTTTHWSVVSAAQQLGSPAAFEALAQLCRTYWFPLYAYVRRQGHPVAEAQDLTQAFFERLLEKEFLRAVDPRKGRFRSFLLAALGHFLAKEWRRGQARKRGGGLVFLSLEDESVERQYEQVAAADLSPAEVFDRQWALTLLDQAVGRLRAEFIAAGKGTLFDELKVFLTGETQAGGYVDLAARLETTEAALKMAVSRMRRRYGELLRAEIAQTVSGQAEVENELKALLAVLG
jgi:RNA polymerase sigma-70 factor (ECF subfamily)